MKWDVFISHASEDKDDVARPLAQLLASQPNKIFSQQCQRDSNQGKEVTYAT